MSLVLDRVGLSAAGETIVDDVSLELERGTLNVLLGPTLAGKTTLMRLMAGLDRPTAGRVVFDGADVTGLPVRRRSVAMVYQQFVNYPTLSVFENIASPLRVARLGRAEIAARVAEAARLLRLEALLDRLPAQLSGGQQQRTALARALVKRAGLVLLDEPLANLDYKLREELREELPRIFAASGAILVYATTEPTEALLLGGSTAALWQGRVTQFGPTAAVYRHPALLDTARVFSDPPLNELAVVKRGAMLDVAGLDVAGLDAPLRAFGSLADGAYRLAFRAEDISLTPQIAPAPEGALIAPAPRGMGGAGEIRLDGTVSVTEITGSESFVHVDVGVGHWVALLGGVRDLPPATRVTVGIDPRRVFVFDARGAAVPMPAQRSAPVGI